MILKETLFPQDIVKLGTNGINKIWRDAKLKGGGPKRAKTLLGVAEHSIRSQEAPGSARIELKNLLNDYEIYHKREEELMGRMKEKLSGYTIVECCSGKHKGESHISYRGRKRLRYILYEAAISLIARNEELRQLESFT